MRFSLRRNLRCSARGLSCARVLESIFDRVTRHAPTKPPREPFRFSPRTRATVILLGAAGGTTIVSTSDDTSVKHLGLAFVRCERIARAVVYDAILYKRTFNNAYTSDEEREAAYSRCHKKSAERVLEALKANGGNTSTRQKSTTKAEASP